jgi:hypothetical protein
MKYQVSSSQKSVQGAGLHIDVALHLAQEKKLIIRHLAVSKIMRRFEP